MYSTVYIYFVLAMIIYLSYYICTSELFTQAVVNEAIRFCVLFYMLVRLLINLV